MTVPDTTATNKEHDGGKEIKTFAKSGLITLLGSILSAAAGFAITLVVARTLGAAEAGVFFIVVALFMILSEITELGTDTGLVRTAARLKALGRVRAVRTVAVSAMIPVLLLSTLTAVLGFVLAPWLASLFAEPEYHDVAILFIQCAAPFLAVSAARQVALSGVRGMGDLTVYTVLNTAMPVARPLLALAVFAAGLGSGAVMLAWSVPVGLTFLAAAFVLWRLIRRAEAGAPPDPPAEPGERPLLREFWGFSAARGAAATIEIAIVWLNVLVVGAMVSNHDAGVYATASRFITSGTLVLAATRIAVAPQIAALLAVKDFPTAERLNAVATGWVVAASWPLYLALACFGPVVLMLFGEDFTGGGTALAILAVAMLVVLAAGNVQTVLLMGGKSSWSLYNKVAALVVNIGLNLLLIPDHGIVGASIAWAAAYLVDTLAAAFQVRYGMGLRLGLRTIGVSAAAAVFWFGVVGVGFRFAGPPTVAMFALYLAVACAGFGATLWVKRESLHADVLLESVRKRK
ncbi:Membrane protein involved in the export of O-antigen and teichoic acid [Sinosporangium album]|uniref:Membrane protein involved in the export of O-antigen and teichoic acid n=1 Tax=Sinosporangium album TaxID=504805 RepID=A0A1G7UCT6_9ACTN|nr:polysaccharide biosynthesis C-terminal domain-containing protein [Sinosporangium album]SDG45402.1 Membrane protein involved in the export of O-antigen and teichoic acid [Sinosporangium album]